MAAAGVGPKPRPSRRPSRAGRRPSSSPFPSPACSTARPSRGRRRGRHRPPARLLRHRDRHRRRQDRRRRGDRGGARRARRAGARLQAGPDGHRRAARPDVAARRRAARRRRRPATPATSRRYRFGPPVSPHLAAELAGVAIEPATLLARARAAAAGADALVVEGVGGLLVPLDARLPRARPRGASWRCRSWSRPARAWARSTTRC